jgi:hypothetical protein
MNLKKVNEAQQRALEAGGELLGSLCWWALNGATVTHDELLALADRHGLGHAYLPKEVKPSTAFRRAWRSAGRRLAAGHMLREIADTPEELVVGLVEERPDTKALDLDYHVLVRLTWDKRHESIRSDSQHDIVDQVRQLYRHHLDHGSEDIRTMLTGFVRESGLSIRESGGVYLVPPTRMPTLQALAGVVGDIGSNRVFTLPLLDHDGAKDTLAEMARTTLDDEIRAVEQELAAFAASDNETRESTLARRIERFDGLRARVGLFATTLSFKADALNERIVDLQCGLRHRLGMPTPERTSAPSTPKAFDEAVGF